MLNKKAVLFIFAVILLLSFCHVALACLAPCPDVCEVRQTVYPYECLPDSSTDGTDCGDCLECSGGVCPSSDSCTGSTPYCEASTDTCVECLDGGDCTGDCETGDCSSGDCEHRADGTACGGGECGSCDSGDCEEDDTLCTTDPNNICNYITSPDEEYVCVECVEDANCVDWKTCDPNYTCQSALSIGSSGGGLGSSSSSAEIGENLTFTAGPGVFDVDWYIDSGFVWWGSSYSTSSLLVGEHTIKATAGDGTDDEESESITITVVEVASVSAEGVTSTTDTPGASETVYVVKGDPSETITVTAAPDPSGSTWPSGKPTWKFDGADQPTTGSTIPFPIDTVSSSSSGTTVTAICGSSTKAIITVVQELKIKDGDNRYVGNGETLKVVTALAGENIECSLNPGASTLLPTWSITDQSGLTGSTVNFNATHGLSPTEIPIFLYTVTPNDYTISTLGEGGQVLAYPDADKSIKFDLSTLFDIPAQAMIAISKAAAEAGDVVTFTASSPSLTLAFQNQWMERPADPEVDLTYKLTGGVSAGGSAKAKFGTSLLAVPPVLLNAGVYLEASASINANASLSYNGSAATGSCGGGASGSVSVGGEIDIFHGLISCSLEASSTITGTVVDKTSVASNSIKAAIELTVDLEPVTVKYEATAFWGGTGVAFTYPLCDKVELLKKELVLLEKSW